MLSNSICGVFSGSLLLTGICTPGHPSYPLSRVLLVSLEESNPSPVAADQAFCTHIPDDVVGRAFICAYFVRHDRYSGRFPSMVFSTTIFDARQHPPERAPMLDFSAAAVVQQQYERRKNLRQCSIIYSSSKTLLEVWARVINMRVDWSLLVFASSKASTPGFGRC